MRCFAAPEAEEGYQVVRAHHITDHNLVFATIVFEAKCNDGSGDFEPQHKECAHVESPKVTTQQQRQSVTVTISRKARTLCESVSGDDELSTENSS